MVNLARLGVAVGLLGLAGAGVAFYPLWPGVLAALLALYVAALWRWPLLWLLIIPAMLPNLDFSPWTGWLLIQEPDFFLLVTLAVLLLRVPLTGADIRIPGWGGWILGLFVGAALLSTVIGLFVPSVVDGSAIVYLTQANTMRAVKPLLFALALWPFLRARQRSHGDGLSLFGCGMLLGLACVVALVAVERSIFSGIWDFRSDYRVAALFSSMHVGGGHIGAWLAMALPFLAIPLLRWRARWWPLAALLAAAGGYALVVTFARTAYAAALVAMLVTVAGLLLAGFRQSRHWLRGLLAPAVLLVGVGLAVVVASGSAFMASRFAGARADFSVREANWLHGLEVRDTGPIALLFGTGLGTYPRLWFDRAPDRAGPSNIRHIQAAGGDMVRLQGRQVLYFVQKIFPASGAILHLELRLRGGTEGARINVGVCEKWLLYSFDCASAGHRAIAAGVWEDVRLNLTVPGRTGQGGKPIEFYISAAPGSVVDIAGMRLAGADGANLLRNGDFAQGTQFWFFTDDNHVLWRIFNQYLTSFFEGGMLGALALVLLLSGGMAGALHALARGEREAASLAGALAAFAVSCLFDAPLEAPRLALVFYLIALASLGLWSPSPPSTHPEGV